jgi:hypothetical protein
MLNIPFGTTLCFWNQNLPLFHNFFAIREITDLHPIDSKTDRWAPFVSAEVAKTGGYLLSVHEPHMSAQIKKEKYLKKRKIPVTTYHRCPPKLRRPPRPQQDAAGQASRPLRRASSSPRPSFPPHLLLPEAAPLCLHPARSDGGRSLGRRRPRRAGMAEHREPPLPRGPPSRPTSSSACLHPARSSGGRSSGRRRPPQAHKIRRLRSSGGFGEAASGGSRWRQGEVLPAAGRGLAGDGEGGRRSCGRWWGYLGLFFKRYLRFFKWTCGTKFTSAKKAFFYCHVKADKWGPLSDLLSIGFKSMICPNCKKNAVKW